MIEYLNYNGKKLPFAITMSTLVEFKKATGTDFEIALTEGLEKAYESMLLFTILALNKGYELDKPPIYKILWNLITTGSKIGIASKDYIKLLDTEYTQISSLLPLFFVPPSEEDKKK